MSHDGADDGFHEIQLSGKQLVFLFMATTVVSVVIFLCGVLVGRGVKGDTVSAAEAAAVSPSAAPAATVPPTAAPTGEPRTPAAKDYTYSARLENEKPVAESLKATSEAKVTPAEERKPATEPAAAPEPPAAPPAAAPPPTPPTTAAARGATAMPSAAPPPGSPTPRPGTWAVQVVALTDRAAAMAVVQRLTSKGYNAYLVSPQAGAPVQNYKVQVGRYADRSEAEQIKTRLKKEEQFEPWILR